MRLMVNLVGPQDGKGHCPGGSRSGCHTGVRSSCRSCPRATIWPGTISITLVLLLGLRLIWIQVEETFSEDPYLAGEIGYQYTTGVQSLNVSAMVKHFAGFSQPEQGLNTGPVQGGERYLRTTCVDSSPQPRRSDENFYLPVI